MTEQLAYSLRDTMKLPSMPFNEKYLYLAICGKAGSGKDYLLKKITHFFPQINPVVSYTSRPPREGEIDGVDYNFMSNDEAKELIKNNMFLEYRTFRENWVYGTPRSALKEGVNAGVTSPSGLLKLNQNKDILIFPIYVQAPDSVRKKRYIARENGEVNDSWDRRLAADNKDFNNIYQLLEDNFKYYQIVNNTKEIQTWHHLKWVAAIIKKCQYPVNSPKQKSIYCIHKFQPERRISNI